MVYESDLTILKMYPDTKNKVYISQEPEQGRQTHRRDGKHYQAASADGNTNLVLRFMRRSDWTCVEAATELASNCVCSL